MAVQTASQATSGQGDSASFAELLSIQPEAVQKYMVSRDLAKRREGIYVRHALSAEDRYMTMRTETEVFFKLLPLEDFADTLWTRLDWPEDQEAKASALIIDILGNVFLPAQDHLGDVMAQIVDLGGDASGFVVAPTSQRTLTYEDGVKEVMRALGGLTFSPEVRKRIAHIVEMRLRDLHDDLETRELFVKPRKTGGTELDGPTAERIVAAIKTLSVMTKYVDVLPVAAPTRAASSAPGPRAAASATVGSAWTPERVRALYVGTEEERLAIAQMAEKFLKVTEEDPVKMIDAASEVVAPPDGRVVDTELVVGVLAAMAEQGFLGLLREDPRAVALVEAYRVNAGMEGQPETDEVQAMSMFLQVALRGTASLDEAESARFGMRIVNAAKRAGDGHYAGLTYFDAVAGAFRWRDPIKS